MNTLKIFVSGTMVDLRPERDAVARAIASLRLEAMRAETEFSEDSSSRDKILTMARECDIYLGLYNQTRYGWVIPQDGISVTELEFNEAQRLHKPALIFVKQLPKDWTPQDEKEQEQREKQGAFINRVLDFDGGRFRAPEFDSLAQLEDQVAGSLMTLLAQRFKLAVARPPFQAPPDLATFVGRDAHIQTLTAQLAQGGGAHLIHGLFGIGGLGKSALAIHLAHRLRDHFEGGVLWADLPTRRPADQLAEWGRAYGEEGLSRIEDMRERALALRRILQGRRVLAILDGAVDERDDDKLAPLLEALADSAVIVTSRVTQLASLQNAHRVDLDKLSPGETEELFVRIVGAERLANQREAIQQVGQSVDFLPLALDLAASQLREHKSWTLEALRDKLCDARGRLDTLKWGDGRQRSVRASCEVSYAALDSGEQAFFAALGAFGGEDFDTRAAAAVTQAGEPQADELLEKLWRLSMAQEGRAAGRYRLHPLLRDYAREQCQALAAAERRMAEYYSALAQEHGGKIHTAGVHAALAVLDAELANVVAAQRWARGQNDADGARLTRDFVYGAMSDYFYLRAQWDDLLAWSQAGLAACRQLSDERGQSEILKNIGAVHDCKGEYDAALAAYAESRAIAERIGDTAGLARTLTNIGNVHYSKGEYDAALAAYAESRAIAERIGDTAGLATTLMNIGIVHRSKGEYDAALAAHAESRAIKERIGDTAGLAGLLNSIGDVHYSKGEYDAALAAYAESRAIAERIGDAAGLAATFNSIGEVRRLKGEYNAALAAYGESRAISERIGDTAGLAGLLNSIGNVHYSKGEYDAALKAYAESRAISERIGDTAGLAIVLNIGEVYRHKGEYDAALAAYAESRAIMERIGDAAGLATTLMNIGSVHASKGEYDAALAAYAESRAVKKRIGDTAGLAGTLWNTALVYERQKRLEEAWPLMEQAIEIERRIGLPDVERHEAYLRNSRARRAGIGKLKLALQRLFTAKH
jgi:tetratricopeptide (TPR) repeat protein